MITIKLYGDLKDKMEKSIRSPGSPLKLEIKNSGISDIGDLLRKLEISESEISHIFVNGCYSSINKKIRNNDRIAFFPRNMGLLYKWYFNKDE